MRGPIIALLFLQLQKSGYSGSMGGPFCVAVHKAFRRHTSGKTSGFNSIGIRIFKIVLLVLTIDMRQRAEPIQLCFVHSFFAICWHDAIPLCEQRSTAYLLFAY